MRKLILSLVSLLLLLSLCGCRWVDNPQDPFDFLYDYYGTSNEESTPSIPKTFTLPYFNNDKLNPMSCTDMTSKTVCPLLFETLYSLDKTFTPYPVLVENTQYADSAYTFTLRSDVIFSDGSPLTSHDVQSSLLRAQLSERYGSRFSNVASIKTLDELTIQIQLMERDDNFISLLDIPIIKDGTEDYQCPIGTGPYIYSESNDSTFLQANELWWQNKILPIQQINLLPCKGSENAVFAFSVQDVQLVISDLTGTNVASISGNGNYTDADTADFIYLGINTNNPLFSENSTRKALSLALNRENLVNVCLLGHGKPAQFPISPVSPNYPSDLETTYSVIAYSNMLQQLNLNTGEQKNQISLLVNAENTFKTDLAFRIASALSYGDIQVSVNVLPWEEYLLALGEGNFDLYLGECQLNGEWDITQLVGTEGSMNYSLYSSEILDSMLHIYKETSGESHKIAAHALYSELLYESPIIPICFKNLSILTAEGLVEDMHPTARNPYENIENWKINIAN